MDHIIGDRFKIQEVLGKGGMGVVYKVRDLRLNTTIALKKLLRVEENVVDTERLKHEVLLARKVTHENVCRVYELMEIGGEEYISMEFVSGRNIRAIMRQSGGIPTKDALHYLKQILSGLEAAHKMGVIHCDLKPENVLVTPEGKPKIMDFGIARALDQSVDDQTPLIGTPLFLAPEQLKGGEIDQRTDLYAVGMLMYIMLTGQNPFPSPTLETLVYQILEMLPAPPSSHNEQLPKELDDIALKALAKDPTQRFQNAQEFIIAIHEYEGSLIEQILSELSTTRQRLIRTMAVLETHRSMTTSSSADQMLDILLEMAIREVFAERASLFLLDEREDILRSYIFAGCKEDPIEIPMGNGIAGQAAMNRQVLIINDAYADPRFNREIDQRTGFHTQNILTVPLISYRGETMGVLQLLNKFQGDFTQEDAFFIKQVGSHAVTLLENSRITAGGVTQHQAVQSVYSDLPSNILGSPPALEGLRIASGIINSEASLPFLWDALRLDDGRSRLFFGYLDGKIPGIPGCHTLQGAFRVAARNSDTLPHLLFMVHQAIKDMLIPDTVLKCVLMEHDPRERRIFYENAGFELLMLIPVHASPLILHKTSPPLSADHPLKKDRDRTSFPFPPGTGVYVAAIRGIETVVPLRGKLRAFWSIQERAVDLSEQLSRVAKLYDQPTGVVNEASSVVHLLIQESS